MKTLYRVGIYCRLSVDDANNSAKAKNYIPADESVSIENQRELLSKFVMLNGWIEAKTYIDDGYSGGNFQRPGFLEMLEDARNGVINLILVKDLSRLGRDFVEVGRYEGEWKDGAPVGFGKLYDRAGETLYQGQFSGGTLDGAWLLGLTADGLRQALGEEHTVSYRENTRSYLIASAELGVVARCSYRTEEGESEVYSVYLSAGKDGWFRLLPGEDNVSTPVWPENAARSVGPLQFNAPEGVNVPRGVYHSIMVSEPDKDLRTTLLYQKEGQKTASMLTWSRLSTLPETELEARKQRKARRWRSSSTR